MIDREEARALLGGPKQELPDNPQNPEEILEAMKAASANYYCDAIATNCHTFIEFTGLIDEYIKICERNFKRGIDFTQANVHNDGPRLRIEEWECDYINDKLRCIFPNLRMVKLDDLKKLHHSEEEERRETIDDYAGEAVLDRYIDPEEFNVEPSGYF